MVVYKSSSCVTALKVMLKVSHGVTLPRSVRERGETERECERGKRERERARREREKEREKERERKREREHCKNWIVNVTTNLE